MTNGALNSDGAQIIEQAIDSLPESDPDRLWLSYALHSPTTPRSVLAMAIQTALRVLDETGQFALGAASSPAVSTAPTVEVPVDVSAPDEEPERVAVPGAPAEVVETDAPDPSTDSTDDQAVAVEDVTPGPFELVDVDDITETVFGSVPEEVDDAVFATGEDGRPVLDIQVVNEEAEEVAAEVVAAEEEAAAEVQAREYVGAQYGPSPLPPIPSLPPLVDADYIGSEPVGR